MEKITGTTEINHSIKCKLGLTIDEYCFIDFLHKCYKKKEKVTLAMCWKQLGFDEIKSKSIKADLLQLCFIRRDEELKTYYPCQQWLDEFETKKPKQTIEYPDNFSDKRIEIFNTWFAYKKDIKDFYKSQKSIDMLFKKFKDVPDDAMELYINNSIAMGYKGIFEVRNVTGLAIKEVVKPPLRRLTKEETNNLF
jgi:hypothetical protein